MQPWSFAEYQSFITEGRYDPGIFKCVFMAGGPGSGKSFLASDLFAIPKTAQFSSFGLKVVNSDNVFETLLRKSGVDPKSLATMDEPSLIKYTGMNYNDEPVDLKSSLRHHAQQLTRKRYEGFMAGKLGMIVDGTGNKIEKVSRQKDEAESAGYDTFMIFVNTTLEVALQRNRQRDRMVRESIVEDLWQKCQDNLDAYQGMFDPNFLVVDTTHGTDPEIQAVVRKYIARIIQRPVQNPIGQDWLRMTP